MSKNSTDSMTVLEHLGELRGRIFVILVAFVIAVVVCFTQADYLRYLIVSPAEGLSLVYFSPPEAFMANLRLALIGGAFLALPVLMYEVLAFLFPGLYAHERRFAIGVAFGGLVLFAAGIAFAYLVVLQLVLHFFLRFETTQLSPMFNVSNYISFVFTLHLSFGLFFQLPMVMWVLGKLELISTELLKRQRKFAILIMLGAAAIITPPDIISQLLLIIPLFFLYELGLIAVWRTEKKREKMQTE